MLLSYWTAHHACPGIYMEISQGGEKHFITSGAHEGTGIGGAVSGGTAQGRGLGLVGTALQQPIGCGIAVPGMGFQSLLYALQPRSDHPSG